MGVGGVTGLSQMRRGCDYIGSCAGVKRAT